MSQIHKGKITNILILNKPISQYGLNFNKQISECLVSKTQTKKIDKIKIKQNNDNINSIDNFLDRKIDENMNYVLLELLNNDKNQEEMPEELDKEIETKNNKKNKKKRK